MSVTSQDVCLVAADIVRAREMLLEEPPRWPSAERVDAAGVQLVISAGLSGIAPPAEVTGATAFLEARARLGFAEGADADGTGGTA